MSPLVRSALVICLSLTMVSPGQPVGLAKQDTTEITKAIDQSLALLAQRQQKDGSWSAGYYVATTAIAGLAFLSRNAEPLSPPYSEVLVKAFRWCVSQAKKGAFPANGSTWIHGQGFAALFLAEFYGKLLTAKARPPGIDLEELKSLVEDAVEAIERAQSHGGGWYYGPDPGDSNEGSTTVTAVQAIRAARNYGIVIDERCLERGFDYLRRSQNADGGFRYDLSPGASMVEGSAAALSSLLLMTRIDAQILESGYKYLASKGPTGISASARFPYYGHFYSAMAMRLIRENYARRMPESEKWFEKTAKEILAMRTGDGTWRSSYNEDSSQDYATAFAVLILETERGHVSVYHRELPRLPNVRRWTFRVERTPG